MHTSTVRMRCPNDASPIPLVADVRDGAEPVQFYFCLSCDELFAYVGKPERYAAGFSWDSRWGRWQVFRAVRSGSDLDAATAAVSQVGRP